MICLLYLVSAQLGLLNLGDDTQAPGYEAPPLARCSVERVEFHAILTHGGCG